MRPHLNCREGETVFIRAVVLEAASDYFKVRIEDFPSIIITTHVPVSEVAKAEDISGLRKMRRQDLTHLDPAFSVVDGVTVQKLGK